MPNSKPFPSKEADLNLYFQAAVPYLIDNKVRLLIDDPTVVKLKDGLNEWNVVFPPTQVKSTSTQAMVMDKNESKKNFKALLRKVYGDIPASVITSQDITTLNISAKSGTRTPAPVPTTQPIGKVSTSKPLEHTISFMNADGTHAKPHGVRGCQIWFKIGEPSTGSSDLNYMATDTKSPYIYHFADEFAGKTVYYRFRWENTRGQVGPWSDVVMATITG